MVRVTYVTGKKFFEQTSHHENRRRLLLGPTVDQRSTSRGTKNVKTLVWKVTHGVVTVLKTLHIFTVTSYIFLCVISVG